MPEISVTGDKVLIDGYKHIDLPIGTIIMNAGHNGGTSFGSAFKLCNGDSLSTTAYDELFQVINYKYGGSGGSFNLPDFVNRFPIGLLTFDATQIPDDPDKSSNRQGGSTIIKSTQFTHQHTSVSGLPLPSGVPGAVASLNITAAEYDGPGSGEDRKTTKIQYSNYGNTTVTDKATPQNHLPPYYTLNYFIYTGKEVIG